MALQAFVGIWLLGHTVAMRVGRIHSSEWNAAVPVCETFGTSHDKTCAGGQKVKTLLTNSSGETDPLKCLQLCRDMTKEAGNVCCAWTDHGQCTATPLGAVTQARQGTGLATMCSTVQDAPEWQIRDTEDHHKFLLDPSATIGVSTEEKANWQRAVDLHPKRAHFDFVKSEPSLFRMLAPGGLLQGKLGDCWLVAALSAFARYPRAVQALFRQQSLTEEGNYLVQLYNVAEHAWVSISVDDKVPATTDAQAKMLAVTHEHEIWAVLLEKAFAKLLNRRKELFGDKDAGYKRLSGGFAVWAFITLTGGESQMVFKNAAWVTDDQSKISSWFQYSPNTVAMANEIKNGNPTALVLERYPNGEPKADIPVSSDSLWLHMRNAMKNNYLMSCNILKRQDEQNLVKKNGDGENGEVLRTDGLFAGHAYGVLNAVDIIAGEPLSVCKESVIVTYKTRQEYQEVLGELEGEASEPGKHYSAWGPGDVVYSFYQGKRGGKSFKHLQLLVRGVSTRKDCEGERCVSYEVKLSSRQKAQGIKEWAGRRQLPLSWVSGKAPSIDSPQGRGFGTGDTVWANYQSSKNKKSAKKVRFVVQDIGTFNDPECDGEPCVTYDRNPSAEKEAQGVSDWAGRKKLPLSWVIGRDPTIGVRYRGWGVGDVVSAHYQARSGGKSSSLMQFVVTQISMEKKCEDEPCVTYDRNPSAELKQQDVSGWAGRAKLPLSWVIGLRHGGHTTNHGVRAGWLLASVQPQDVGQAVSLTFEGIVDQSVCEDPGDRTARYVDMSVASRTSAIRLVRVRNPWGQGQEYNGPWSDADPDIWLDHPDVAAALNHMAAPDGSWWMTFDAFTAAMHYVTISTVNMAKFNPPPPQCNTNWGATMYLPNGPEPTPLDWSGHTRQPTAKQCAWCSTHDRARFWSSESCETVYGGEVVGHAAWKGSRGSTKLCCAIVEL